MSNTEAPLGERVKNARVSLGWGQAKLAEHLGVTQASVSRIEAGAKHSGVVGRALVAFLESVKSGALKPEPATTAG